MEVLLAAMLVHALHAALENGEIALDSVGVNRAVGEIDILACAVRRPTVTRKLAADSPIGVVLVRHDGRLARDVRADDRHQRGGVHVVHHHRPGAARLAVDQRQHLHLVVERALDRRTLNATDEGFVHLDNAAARAEGREVAGTHGFADAMGEEPRTLILHL